MVVGTFSNDHGVSLDPESWGPQAPLGTSFLAFDPPRHTRLRGLVSKGFTPRRVGELEQSIRDHNPAIRLITRPSVPGSGQTLGSHPVLT